MASVSLDAAPPGALIIRAALARFFSNAEACEMTRRPSQHTLVPEVWEAGLLTVLRAGSTVDPERSGGPVLAAENSFSLNQSVPQVESARRFEVLLTGSEQYDQGSQSKKRRQEATSDDSQRTEGREEV